MDTTTRSAGFDTRVALVGGAGVFVAHVLSFRPIGLWAGPVPSLLQSVVLLLAFAVLAFGLPPALTGDRAAGRSPRTGLIGSGRLARGALLAAGILPLIGSIGGALFPTDPEVFFSSGVRALALVLDCVGYAGVLALVAAAVFSITSDGAWRGARIGLGVLAILGALVILLPVPFGLLSPDALLPFVNVWNWTYRLSEVAACLVGIALAWPWLASRVDRATSAADRAHDRWVDSTP